MNRSEIEMDDNSTAGMTTVIEVLATIASIGSSTDQSRASD